MRDTVTVLRPTETRNSRGNVVNGDPTATDVPGCAVLPAPTLARTSKEDTTASDTVTSMRVLFAPPGTDIRPTDRVRFGGVTYDVIGQPADYDRTGVAHLELTLRAVI